MSFPVVYNNKNSIISTNLTKRHPKVMQIIYIVLAHRNPLQLKRLVSRLTAPWVSFYIHIDRNVPIGTFQREISHDSVFFLKNNERKAGTWGDLEIVKAVLVAVQKAISKQKNGYCILLTGQDYPLRSNFEIKEYLEQNNNSLFIDFYAKPGKWPLPMLERINQYKINRSSRRGDFIMLPSLYDKEFYSRSTLGKLHYLNTLGRLREAKVIFRKRRFPENLKPYGGSVYWALPVSILSKILEYLTDNDDYINYHQYTLCADEIFFHSIIMHLKPLYNFKILPSLTYANWERKEGSLPVTFKEEDIEELKEASQKFLFARKFDIKEGKEILDKCDEELLSL